MRLLSPVFIEAFPNAILNIHPSLLPAFPGLEAQHQAWAHGVKVSGATVHLVNRDLDAGPIVLQRAVPVLDDDTAETRSRPASSSGSTSSTRRPSACVLSGQWQLDGRRSAERRDWRPPEIGSVDEFRLSAIVAASCRSRTSPRSSPDPMMGPRCELKFVPIQ